MVGEFILDAGGSVADGIAEDENFVVFVVGLMIFLCVVQKFSCFR